MEVEQYLREIQQDLRIKGLEVDHYEIREARDDYRERTGLDRPGPDRVSGESPDELLEKWTGGNDIVVEVFLGGDRELDRLIYEPGKLGEDPEYVSFSGMDYEDLFE